MRLLSDPRSRRAALAAAVGLLAVAVPGALALEAWRATRRHRQAAERALRDHASFAALSYRQRVIARLYGAVNAVLAPVGNPRAAHPAGPLPPLAPLRRAAEAALACDCGPAVVPSYYFRLALADSSLELDGPPLAPERRAWLAAEFSNLGELRTARDWELISSVDTIAPAGGQLVYATARRGPDGAVRALYGFAVPLASLRETMLRPVVAGPPLLPVDPRTAPPNDSLLSVALLPPRGVVRPPLALSPRPLPADYAVTIPGGAYLGGWPIRVSLDPRAAPPVLIGGLPPSRTPLLAALLALAAALVATTLAVAWRALALARLRADFVSGVSHELRTPLAQILLFAETLAAGRMDSRRDVRDAGRVIVGEAQRLIQLVENVLLFGRAARGGGTGNGAASRAALPPEPLAPLVREVLAAFAPIAATADARLRTTRLDDVAAPADRAAVRQILLNLLDNAVKYGPRGQTVSVGLALVGAPERPRARLWVEDEGPGIPAADRERVWQPFVRLPRDVAAQVGGSGIGLAVVRDLVARHGGSARVDAAPAGGACVLVELPNASACAAAEAAATCAS